MRPLLVPLMLVLPAPAARADAEVTWTPLRLYIECQGGGRTKACPAFVRGFIEESPVLVWAPLAEAQVVVYYNATYSGQDDRVHLRFKGNQDGLPALLEVEQKLDSRASDDEQRAQLRPAFHRGIAPFVGALLPEAVKIELIPPENRHKVEAATTPWGFSTWFGGSGSRSDKFTQASGWAGVGVSRVEAHRLFYCELSGDYGIERQPSLIVDDQEVSLDVDRYSAQLRAGFSNHLSPHWAVGLLLRGGLEDPEGRYRHTVRGHAMLSRDWFPSDDPRGNVLSLAYVAGYQVDRYNVRNVLKERFAHFPSHGLLLSGSVRVDTITYNVYASAIAMVAEPHRRYVLDVSPQITISLGDHLDLNVAAGLTRQAVPGPLDLDPSDFEQVTRSSYADPLRLYTSFNLRLFWDPTNGARNNRLEFSSRLGNLASL